MNALLKHWYSFIKDKNIECCIIHYKNTIAFLSMNSIKIVKSFSSLTFPLGKHCSPDEEKQENDDEIDHDGHQNQVRWHVGLLSDGVSHDGIVLAVGGRRQFRIATPHAAPTAADAAGKGF